MHLVKPPSIITQINVHAYNVTLYCDKHQCLLPTDAMVVVFYLVAQDQTRILITG